MAAVTRVAAWHLAITWRCLHPVQLNAGINPADVYPPLTGQEIHGALRRPAGPSLGWYSAAQKAALRSCRR